MLHHSPSPSPSVSPSNPYTDLSSSSTTTTPPSKLPVDFSPPLIAMVVTIATAFVIITYSRLLSRHFIHNYRRYRQWRHQRRRYAPSNGGDIQSPPYPFADPSQAFHVLSPYGLDESIIKTIPLSIYNNNNNNRNNKTGSIVNDCAVCLLEFEDSDYVRTLPICKHAFHVDCIDIWLKSHANCPMCRAGIFRPDSPFTPLMSARIRPSLDDIVLESAVLEPLTEIEPLTPSVTEIEIEITTQSQSHSPIIQSEDRSFDNRRDFLLKRSYSFGFERNLGSERSLVMEPATASPWRYRRSGAGAGSFWSKNRPSPFSSLTKPRVFSFRYYNRMKSPNFFRRRSMSGFFPLSEPSVRLGSSRRRSSRLRSGDPEALLSPERFNRRRGL